jgi:RHS repeat-associated protein
MAFLNPFLFSSKYYDWETGLLYYGHRYYSPSLARWLSRDPIEENGGPNVYGFAGNDPVNALDLFGLLITCQCPETYFNENGLKDKYEKEADDTYSAKAGASGPTTGDGAILWNMLLTKHNFVIKDYTADNLKLHVASRNIIIKNALNSLVGFGHNPVIRRPSPTANPDPQAYYDSLNNTQTALGCQVWSEIIFQTGNRYKTRVKRDIDGVWIPGDWGWINNKNFRHGGSWTAGFEGENVFNTGNDLFWGLDLPNKHNPESKSWWWNQIKTTFISNDGKTFGDPEWDKNKAITFPGVGLAP